MTPRRGGTCKECGHRVRWVTVPTRKHDGSTTPLPLEPRPSPDGNVILSGDGKHGQVLGGDRLRAARRMRRLTPLYMPHQAVCPKRKKDAG